MSHEHAARWFAGFWSIGLLILLVIRAWNMQVTPDEAFTYNAFIQPGYTLKPWVKWEANNHLLNTILSAISLKVFTPQLFALRLPNLISWILFTWSAFQLLKPLKRFELRSSGLVVLSASPLLLEFFSLSRGYGMSMALMLFSLTLMRSVLEGKHDRAFWWLPVAALMLLANLNLLPLVTLSGGVVALTIQQRRVIFTASFLLLLATFIWYGLLLKDQGLLYFGGNGFWSATIQKSAAELAGSDWGKWLYLLLVVPVMLGLKDQRLGNPLRPERFPMLLLLLVLFQVIGVFVQHLVLGTPYPEGRTAMHLWLLFTVVAVLFSHAVPRAAWWYGTLAIGFVVSTALALEVNRSYYWRDSFISEELLDTMENRKQDNPALSVGIAYPYLYTWSILQRSRPNPIIPQRLSTTHPLHTYDVIALPSDQAEPDGFEPMIGNAQEAFQFYEREGEVERQEPNPYRTVEENSSMEFLTFVEERMHQDQASMKLVVDLSIETNDTGEMFLVFRSDDGRYEQIDLMDYADRGRLETTIVRHLFGNAQRETRWSVYLWNPSGLEVTTKAEVRIHRNTSAQNIEG